jgi:hypothetical protein
MKSLKDYLTESEQWMSSPATGDVFSFEFEDETLVETYIIEVADDCILLDATPAIISVLEEWAILEDTDEGDSGVILETMGYGSLVGEGQMKQAMHKDAERMTLEQFVDKYGDEEWIREFYNNIMGDLDEAKYQGREVTLNKPMAGDVKKSKVYVRDPATGNIKKVNFGHGGKTARRLGQKTMKIKKSNPARRKSFRARHNCANPGSKLKARYWSCRAW